MTRRSPSPAADLVRFFASATIVYCGATQAFSKFCSMIGAPQEALQEILRENEMGLQSFSIFIALYVCYRARTGGRLSGFVRTLLPNLRITNEAALDAASRGLFRGFLAASAGVAFSLFLGFATLEGPRWEGAAVLEILPSLIVQAAGLVVWILLTDRAVDFLWRGLTAYGRNLPRAILVGSLAFAAYRIFVGPMDGLGTWEQAFPGLVTILASAAYLVWYEAGRKLHGSPIRAWLVRFSTLSGFFLAWIHVYGKEVGGTRALSLMNLFEGPVAVADLPGGAVVGDVPLVLTLVLAVNVLLRRVLVRRHA